MAEKRQRKITIMPNDRVRFRQHVYIELSQQDYDRFDKESDYSAFINGLIEDHYNPEIMNVRIDEKIREAYSNDIYKDFRIPMLLLEFYLKGKIDSINETSISLSNEKDNTDKNEVNVISSEKQSYENELDTHKELVEHIKDVNDIKNEDIQKSIEVNEEVENSNIVEEYRASTEKQMKSTEVDISNEGVIKVEVKKDEDKDIKPLDKNLKSSQNLSGTLKDIMPMNNKSLL